MGEAYSSCKKVLYSTLQQQCLNDENFHTILCEAEAILNDRPITKLSDDPNDLEALTPNHILQLRSKPFLPPGLFQKSDLYIRRRWRQVQYLSDLFWKRWIRNIFHCFRNDKNGVGHVETSLLVI